MQSRKDLQEQDCRPSLLPTSIQTPSPLRILWLITLIIFSQIFPATPYFEVPCSLPPQQYWTIYCYCELVCHLPVGFYKVHAARAAFTLNSRGSWILLLTCTFQSASHLGLFPLILIIIWGYSSCPLTAPFLHESSIHII